MNAGVADSLIKRSAITAVALAAGLFPSTGHAAAPGSGQWTQQEPRGVSVNQPDLVQIQCPTTRACYVLGSRPISSDSGPGIAQRTFGRTTDGGVTWTSQTLDIPAAQPSQGTTHILACPGEQTCYLLVNASATPQIWRTDDGGQTWAHEAAPLAGSLQMISCPTTTVCYVAESTPDPAGGNPTQTLLSTRDGGGKWTASDLTSRATVGPPGMLVCPAVDTCYMGASLLGPPGGGQSAVQALVVTHNGGTTWTSWQVGQMSEFSSMACPTADTCYAVGNGTMATTRNGGASWDDSPAPWRYEWQSKLVCASTTACYVLILGTGVWATTDGGISWQSAKIITSYQLVDVACPAVTTCFAVGDAGTVFKTIDGKTWTEPGAPVGGPLDTVSCPAARDCFAGGDPGVILNTMDGKTWKRDRTMPDFRALSLACPSTTTCLAAGFGADPSTTQFLRTTDGGASWNSVGSYRSYFPGGRLTCASVSVCFLPLNIGWVTIADGISLGGGNILRTTNGGASWNAYALPEGYSIQSISCPGAQTCVAAGGQEPCNDDLARPTSGNAVKTSPATRRAPHFPCNLELGWLFKTTDGGRTWHRVAFQQLALASVSCGDSSTCFVSGDGIWGRSTDGGSHWTFAHRQTGPQATPPAELDCLGRTTCWALALNQQGGSTPVLTTDAGRTWKSVTRGLPSTPSNYLTGLHALDCRSVNSCVAVGGEGLIVSYSP